MIIDPKDIPIAQVQRYMLGSVAPRPIAFVSSIDGEGNVNLSPYSNFNFFGANPPILIFSASRRVRDSTTKHTLENAKEVPEVVVNIVSYDMVEQMSLSSTEYDEGINEFIKAGLTQEPSIKVSPPRVKESPVSFECRVDRVLPLGEGPGSGNLVICEVLLIHINDKVLDRNDMIDPFKLDAVARMGGNWYARANGDVLFEVEKPLQEKGIGFDLLPAEVFDYGFSKNELARLANVKVLPEGRKYCDAGKVEAIEKAKNLLKTNQVIEAWEYILGIRSNHE